MSKILLMCEKLSLVSHILLEYKRNKNNFFEENDIYICLSNPATTPVYQYPTDIKYKDYPKSNNVKLKWNKNFKKMNSYKVLNEYEKGGDLCFIKNKKDFNQDFEEIVVIQDKDYIGAYYAISILSFVYGENYEDKFNVSYVTYYYSENLYIETEKARSGDKSLKILFKDLARAGKDKQYFQYNYNINSMIFFKEIFKHLNINSNVKKQKDKYKWEPNHKDINMSKNMLLLLHILYNSKYNEKFKIDFLKKGVKKSVLIDFMSSYKGSTKFTKKSKYSYFTIGSAATQYSIVNNLLDLDLISLDKIDSEFLRSTIKGIEFFKCLNNKTFDIDLPFRLESWLDSSFDGFNIKEKIDSYLYNFFIGQKRKNNKQFKRD